MGRRVLLLHLVMIFDGGGAFRTCLRVLRRRGLLVFALDCRRRRGKTSESFFVGTLPIVLHEHVSRLVDVLLLDLDALVTEAVPGDLATFFDDVAGLVTLIQVVQELG